MQDPNELNLNEVLGAIFGRNGSVPTALANMREGDRLSLQAMSVRDSTTQQAAQQLMLAGIFQTAMALRGEATLEALYCAARVTLHNAFCDLLENVSDAHAAMQDGRYPAEKVIRAAPESETPALLTGTLSIALAVGFGAPSHYPMRIEEINGAIAEDGFIKRYQLANQAAMDNAAMLTHKVPEAEEAAH